MDKLTSLLQTHQLLLGHPNLKNLQREIADALAKLDASYAPRPKVEDDETLVVRNHDGTETEIGRRI